MVELTMQDVAKRLAELEQKVALLSGKPQSGKDWRRSVGMFEGSEFMRQVDSEIMAAREAEREAARAGEAE